MERYVRLQVSIFGNFREIDLSQESLGKLYQIYLKEAMMPSVIKEFDVLSQNVINRPGFIANDNSVNISIASDRMDVISDANMGNNVLSKADFKEKACRYMKEFFDIFNVGIFRMSYIEEGIVKIIDDLSEDTFKDQFINSKRVYKSNEVFEWSANNVSLDEWDINGVGEKVNLNVTTSLRKINVVQNNQPRTLRAFMLTQDLNTLAENTSARLGYNDIQTFVESAIIKSEEITKTVEG